MNIVFLSFLKALALLPVLSAAIHVPITQVGRRGLSTLEKRQSSANNTNGLDLTTVRDLIYMSSMTAGGKEYLVQMDTGSSDVWLKGDIHPLTNSKQTSITANLTFGIGWVSGTVSHIPVEFAGVSIPSQAYLDVTEADNPALSYNADGLIGLGFTSLSTIDNMVNATGSSDGRSLLFNLFESDPEQDNFIAFSFQRSTDDHDEVQGGFSIGEYEENYTSIADTPKISTWPTVAPKRWNILVEAFIVGDKEVIPSTIVPDVPGNKAVALLDTGTSYSYVPKDICDAIYGGIQGASYNGDTGYWSVPCSAEIDMAIQIAGRTFPLHPLDVSPSAYQGDNTCIGSFVPETIAADTDQFDYIFGVNVLRSMYSLYDFGDFDSNGKMGDPYIKLLSLTDPDAASAAFCSSRTCTPRTGITYKTSSNTHDGPVMSVSVSGSTAEALQKFTTWFPAMLGIMALNALVLLGLLILGLVLTIRKCRTKKARARHPATRPLRDSSGGQNHTYEPVSMAMTEDTMVPPMPAFHKFEGSSLRPGDRPKSMATLPSNSKEYEDDTEEALLPPGFKQFDMRPRSVGAFPAQPNTYQKSGVDEPFIPPYQVPQNEGGHVVSRPPSKRSPSTGSSNHSQSDDANSASPEDSPPLPPSPSARSFHDSARPSSRYVDQQQPSTPPSIHVSQTVEENVPLPPSPSIRSFRDSSRPSSRYMVEPGQPSPPPPRLSPLAGASVASLGQEDQILAPPRPSFRPRVPSAGDRPQSTVVLPSQTNNPYRPDARRLPSQSSLRPRGGNPTDDRPMSSAY